MEITTAESFLTYFEKVRERTLRVARCIPPDHLEWRYREGTFSFGDILRHLGAIERYMFAENAALRPSRYPGHGRELADGYEEVFAYLSRMHAEAVEIFAGLSPSDLQKKCVTPGGAELAVWKWLRSNDLAEVHHRADLHVSVNDGVPGASFMVLLRRK